MPTILVQCDKLEENSNSLSCTWRIGNHQYEMCVQAHGQLSNIKKTPVTDIMSLATSPRNETVKISQSIFRSYSYQSNDVRTLSHQKRHPSYA